MSLITFSLIVLCFGVVFYKIDKVSKQIQNYEEKTDNLIIGLDSVKENLVRLDEIFIPFGKGKGYSELPSSKGLTEQTQKALLELLIEFNRMVLKSYIQDSQGVNFIIRSSSDHDCFWILSSEEMMRLLTQMILPELMISCTMEEMLKEKRGQELYFPNVRGNINDVYFIKPNKEEIEKIKN